jgi:hypothetical protein
MQSYRMETPVKFNAWSEAGGGGWEGKYGV